MKTYRILVTTEANAAINKAFDFIDAHSPVDARRWVVNTYRALDTLARHPTRCPLAPESGYAGSELRHLFCGSHRIIFRVEETQFVVRVLYVRHMAQRAVGEPISEGDDQEADV